MVRELGNVIDVGVRMSLDFIEAFWWLSEK